MSSTLANLISSNRPMRPSCKGSNGPHKEEEGQSEAFKQAVLEAVSGESIFGKTAAPERLCAREINYGRSHSGWNITYTKEDPEEAEGKRQKEEVIQDAAKRKKKRAWRMQPDRLGCRGHLSTL